ncbi:MAG: hypothetical protein R3B82_16210 [Sandaracinaceae bacterium]
MRPLSTLLWLVLLGACGARGEGLDLSPRGVAPSVDGGIARPDAATRRDAGPGRDAGFDAGVDAGPPDLELGLALACELGPEEAMQAAARFVACDAAAERATVVAIVEAWEAGLLAHVEESGGLIEGLALDLGCEGWRCAAEATSCREYEACLTAGLVRGRCPAYETSCEGDTLLRCNAEGRGRRPLVDCARFGAECREGAAGSATAPSGRTTTTSRATTTTSPSVRERRLDCDAWAPGSRCTSFYIGGEVPTKWCSPTGGGEAGGYARPVDCVGGTIRFTSVSTRTYELDCLALGYAGCDERGCIP